MAGEPKVLVVLAGTMSVWTGGAWRVAFRDSGVVAVLAAPVPFVGGGEVPPRGNPCPSLCLGRGGDVRGRLGGEPALAIG